MSHNKGAAPLVLGVIIVLAILAAGTGVYLWRNELGCHWWPTTLPWCQYFRVASEQVPASTTSTDPTAGWKTYRTGGVEVKYPSSWYIKLFNRASGDHIIALDDRVLPPPVYDKGLVSPNEYAGKISVSIKANKNYEVVSLEDVCSQRDQIYFSPDRILAVCKKDDSFELYKSVKGKGDYRRDDIFYGFLRHIGIETPEYLEAGKYLYVSFYDNIGGPTYSPKYVVGPIIVRLNTTDKTLKVLADVTMIPNKELFSAGGFDYGPSFVLLPDIYYKGLLSPTQRYLIVGIVSCTGCETRGWLYVLDIENQKLYFSGAYLPDVDESAGKKFEFRWLDDRSVNLGDRIFEVPV